MAKESSAIAGSGISLLREGLTPNSKGPVPAIRGTNSVLANYEDIQSKIGLVQSSGLAVSTFPIHLTGPGIRLKGRRQLTIQNLGAGVVYVGDSTVTTATGLRIAVDELLTLDVLDFGDLYVIGAAAADVRVLELK